MDPGKLTSKQFFRQLKNGQVWALLGIVAGLIAGAFALGYKASSMMVTDPKLAEKDAQLTAAFLEVEKKTVDLKRATAEKLPLWLERVVVPVTNTLSTLIGFRHNSQPPWPDGNYLSFHYRKASDPGQMEQWAAWNVVNMHAENFSEITRRLMISSIEVHVLHTGASPSRVQEVGRPERTIITDEGMAVVTDARIAREWFLAEPGGNVGGKTHIGLKTARELKAAYPESFRASD